MDDPARRVERRVLGGGPQGGVVGSVSWGLVCQQALLPEKWQCQVSVVVPVQLCWKVIGAPSEQPIPAAAQQNLVLEGETEKQQHCYSRLHGPELGEVAAALGARTDASLLSRILGVEASGPKLGCLLGKEAII